MQDHQAPRHLGPIRGDQQQPAHLATERIISDWLRHHTTDWRTRTIDGRRRAAWRFARYLATEQTTIVHATEQQCLAYRDSRGIGPDALAGEVSMLRSLFDYIVVVRRLRPDNPVQAIKPPRRPRYGVERVPDPMLESELEIAEEFAELDPEMRVWLLLMGHHGMRPSDLAWLRTGDVIDRDGGKGKARVTGKGGRVRLVPINRECMDALRPFLATSGPLFTRQSGRPYEPDDISRLISAYLKSVGVTRRPYSLRHRFATEFAKVDPDIRHLQKLLGHARTDTTMIYTLVDEEDCAAGVDALTRKTNQRRRQKRSMTVIKPPPPEDTT